MRTATLSSGLCRKSKTGKAPHHNTLDQIPANYETARVPGWRAEADSAHWVQDGSESSSWAVSHTGGSSGGLAFAGSVTPIGSAASVRDPRAAQRLTHWPAASLRAGCLQAVRRNPAAVPAERKIAGRK